MKNKRFKKYKCHFGKDNIILEDFCFNPVHIVPKRFEYDREVDFYLDTGYDIYLVRFRHNNKNKITFIYRNSEDSIIYICIEKLLDGKEFKNELNLAVRLLKILPIQRKKFDDCISFPIDEYINN